MNAGYNPPMLFLKAAEGGEVVRLEAGGMVIGLIEDCVYQQGTVTLAAGDVLVAYTDGVSEAAQVNDSLDALRGVFAELEADASTTRALL